MDVPSVPADTPAQHDADAGGRAALLGRLPADLPLSVAAAGLRERIYGSIACLATLLLITGDAALDHPWTNVLDVLVATGGLWTASVLAEAVAHLGAHGSAPDARELRHIFWVSGQIMAASAVPLVLLALAGLGVFSTHVAVWSGVWVLVVEMGLFAFLTVRHTSLSLFRKFLLVAALVALGLVVVLLKTLAH